MKKVLLSCSVILVAVCSFAQFTTIHPSGLESSSYADFTGDGISDVVGIEQSNGTLVLIAGNALIEFEAASVIANGFFDSYLSVEDFDSDGDMDLIVTGSFNIIILLNDGGGSFTSAFFDINNHLPADWPPNDGSICLVYEAEFLDLNSDDILDLFVTMTNCMGSGQYEMLTLGIAGNGAGGLEPGNITSSFHQAPSDGITRTEQIDKADLDNNGSEEFLILEDAPGMFEAEGVFGYDPINFFDNYFLNSGNEQYRFRLAELDENGFTDLILLTEDGFFAYYGSNSGIAQTGVEIHDDSDGCIDFDIGDVNFDGILDLVAIDSDGEIIVYYGTPSGDYDLFEGLSQNADPYSRIQLLPGDMNSPIRILANGSSADVYQFQEVGTISGAVYVDIDGDELFSNEDYIIPSQSVQVNGGAMIISGAQEFSRFLFFDDYTLELINVDSFLWTPIEPTSYSFTLDSSDPSENSLYFGLSINNATDSIVSTINSANARCNTQRIQTISLHNAGNLPSEGTFIYHVDTLCAINLAPDADLIDIENSLIEFSYSDLLPGMTMNFEVTVTHPGVDYIGDTLTQNLEVLSSSGFETSGSLAQVLTCGYDPNDKTEFSGWMSEGYVAEQGAVLEYLIRFQNTGTDTAFQVIISDFLSQDLDPTSVDIIASSHDYEADVDAFGGVLFIFQNINLVDSVTNELESHGFVRFRIAVNEDVAVGTVIMNTAVIFFDDNPPIQTNSTSNTVFDCETIGQFTENTSPEVICFGEVLEAEIDSILVESATWSLNGNPQGNGNSISIESGLEAGLYDIAVTISNPVCEFTRELEVTIVDAPTAIIEETGPATLNCITDNGTQFQWYLDGALIEGATEQVYQASGDDAGLFTVLVIDANGCSSLSSEYFFDANGLNEYNSISVLLFPNPVKDELTLISDEIPSGSSIEISDMQGRKVYEESMYLSGQLIDVGHLRSATYQLIIRSITGQIVFSTSIQVH